MPEDWLGLPCNKALGAQMASMEGNLRCPICSELIKAAMTAKCGHAFCSACVRAWLGRSTETKFCPTCKVSLRPYRLVPPCAGRRSVGGLL